MIEILAIRTNFDGSSTTGLNKTHFTYNLFTKSFRASLVCKLNSKYTQLVTGDVFVSPNFFNLFRCFDYIN